MKVSELFEKEPRQWGLRGDPYLWQELKERFKETDMPSSIEQLEQIILKEYKKATGFSLNNSAIFVVNRFKRGGMSSGGICPEFWVNKALPLLLSRCVKI